VSEKKIIWPLLERPRSSASARVQRLDLQGTSIPAQLRGVSYREKPISGSLRSVHSRRCISQKFPGVGGGSWWGTRGSAFFARYIGVLKMKGQKSGGQINRVISRIR